MSKNKFSSFLNFFKLNDDEYEDYIDDYDEEEELEREKEEERKARKRAKEFPSFIEAKDKEKTISRQERPVSSKSKVVPLRTTTKGMEVCILKPTSFEDSQEICNTLLQGRAVVVNLEGFDPDDAQRIMDFISGCVYAINGKLHQISKYIFIFSPENVDISGDYLELAKETGFGVPNLNKEF